jgi:OmpA-OmpF porin, OOP family
MKKISTALVTTVAMSFALPAAAQSMSMSNGYVGLAIGQSSFKDACNDFSGAGVSCSDTDTAWRIFAGYQINKNFAAEVGYHNLGETSVSGGGANASVKASAWELVGLGILPFANQFAGYGKLGFYYGKTELDSNFGVSGSDTNTGLTYGLGLQWDATRNLGVRVEYQIYNDMGGDNSGKGDVSVFNIGAIWRFQ